MRKLHGLFSVLLGLSLMLSNFLPAHAEQDDGKKVTICHATASETNPYVENTVSINSIASAADWFNGHGGHDADIWPTFQARNGDAIQAHGDQALLENHCQAVNPTATNTATVPPAPTCQLFLNGDPSFPDTSFTAPFGNGERQDVVSIELTGVESVGYSWELWFPTDPSVPHITGGGTLSNGGQFVVLYPGSDAWGAPDGNGTRESHVTLWIDEPCADRDWDHWFHYNPTATATVTNTTTPFPSVTPSKTLTPTATSTTTPVNTATSTATSTGTLTPSVTPSKTLTPTATLTPSMTATGTITATARPTASLTPSMTSTSKPGPSNTPGVTNTPWMTETPIGGQTPGATLTATNTPAPQNTGAGSDGLPWLLLVGMIFFFPGLAVTFFAKNW